jgi:hypothetical protein
MRLADLEKETRRNAVKTDMYGVGGVSLKW